MDPIRPTKIAFLTTKDKWQGSGLQAALSALPSSLETQIFFYGKKEDLAAQLSQLKSHKFDRALICGGDGSLHYAVEQSLRLDPDTRIPLGVVPVGTANDFARSAGFDISNLSEAVYEAVSATVEKIDVGWINEIPFINVVTGGDVASVTTDLSPGVKSRFGKAAYFLNSLVRLPNLSSHQMTFRGPGWEFSNQCFAFAVGNNNSAGGGIKIAPDARLDDGLLDLLIVPQLSFIELTSLASELAKENPILDGHNVYSRKVSDFTVNARDEIQINVDGEPYFGREFRFRVTPQSLEMALSNKKLVKS